MTDLDRLRDYAVLDGERLAQLWAEIDRLRALVERMRQALASAAAVTNGWVEIK